MTEKIYNDLIKETVLKYTHESGVTVFMMPKEHFSSATAQFTAKFGSQDNAFSLGGGDVVHIPDGTAHYLEHKLFESEENDAFSLFAETGAYCNAGTSFDYTQYYFSCAENFRKNLEILLGFVQEPYFTPETVEKERGIIGQEITMYRDNPNWRVFTDLLEGLYHKNPIRNDIAGTIESISRITDKTLYDCYNAYYNPANMFLCAAGCFDPDEVIAVCEEKLKSRRPLDVRPAAVDEPYGVLKKRVEIQMPVAKPIFEMGFKREYISAENELEECIYFNLLFDLMFGPTSDFFSDNRDSGLINDEFTKGVFSGRGYIVPSIRGESDEPDRVAEKVCEEIRKFKKDPPAREEFDRVKKMGYGDVVKDWGNVGNICDTLSVSALRGSSPFGVIETNAGASYERALEKLQGLDEENFCVSIVKGDNE